MRPLLATYAWLLARLPEAFARANAALLGELLWLIRGKVIRRNLTHAFPEKDAAWVRRIGRTSCRRTAAMWPLRTVCIRRPKPSRRETSFMPKRSRLSRTQRSAAGWSSGR